MVACENERPCLRYRRYCGSGVVALIVTMAISACGGMRGERADAPGAVGVADSSALEANWSLVLARRVDADGFVDFIGLQSDTTFDRVIDQVRMATPSRMASSADRLAFWINAYNALTLKLVTDNLPVSSITDIAGGLTGVLVSGSKSPWELHVAAIEDEERSLQDIEDDEIRQFADERAYFALCRTAVSCPRLARAAYAPAALNEQLTAARDQFLADRTRNYLRNGRLYLSKVFEWHRADFERSAGTLQAWLARYWPDANEATTISHLQDSSIEFLDYNWKLIDQRNRPR